MRLILYLSLIVSSLGASFYPSGAVRALHAELTSLQSPRDCASAHALVLVYSAEDAVNGLAAMFQFAAGALAIARALNRTLIEVLPPRGSERGQAIVGSDPWLRAPARVCGGLKLGCFLEPLSSCAYEGGDVRALPEVASTLRAAREQSGEPILRISSLGAAHSILHAVTRGEGEGAPSWWAAAVGAGGCVYEGARPDNKACARRLYFPAIQAWAFRPLPRIVNMADAAAVHAMRERSSNGSAVWGVHVRLGDASKLGWRASASLPDYLAVAIPGATAEARKSARAAGVPTVPPQLIYVATDSASTRAAVAAAAASLPQVGKSPLFEFLVSPASILSTLDGSDAHAHIETYLRDSLGRDDAQVPPTAASAAIVEGGDTLHPAPPSQQALVRVSAAEYLSPHLAQRLLGNATFEQDSVPASALSALRLTEGIIADIWSLSHASHFVGTCLSQVSRTSYELSYAWGRARAPPVGLDVRACRAWTPHFVAIEADWRESFDHWADDAGAFDTGASVPSSTP